ncbi:HNH endonuclease signature motif containing protein [Mycolicibacterium komossense]|uniref:DUF222 domain-containing protein n=1 Tax=Mycolicibacterium komossense TaxID=1779 RepID=A0ABT3CJX3_9MYCO|nr:HNH endonuclease signature motif containing protein [Mycolicibacterium komossense]MCV7229750.1 DUF222 domain-containing protein [Mycolicibacterium komossense]
MDPVAEARVMAALEAVDAAYSVLADTCTDGVGPAFRMAVAVRLEAAARHHMGLSYRVAGEICDPPDGPAKRGVKARLARELRVNRSEVDRRAKLAARVRGRRVGLGSDALPPELPRLAKALREGLVGEAHIVEVCKALDALPRWVSPVQKSWAEKKLVRHATKQDPAFVAVVGKALDAMLNPDGVFDDRDRQARRAVTMGRQGPDGMSKISGYLTPEARAYFEAISAAVRPGYHVPDTEQTAVDATTDIRTPGQRRHDALVWGMRTALESGNLGAHRGIAVMVIARTTVQDLEQAARAVADQSVPMPPPATTGGGSWLPMRELIAMAAQGAMPYLAVFDGHSERPLYLARGQRLATADHRIICYARDRGCTRPGCTVPGYGCEVHHAPAWVPDGPGDADKLFFACGPDNRAEAVGDYETTVTAEGRLGWSDGTGPPEVNRIHHPEELLAEDDP